MRSSGRPGRATGGGRCCSTTLCTGVGALVAIAVLGNIALYMRRSCDLAVQQAETSALRRYEREIALLQAALASVQQGSTSSAQPPATVDLGGPNGRNLRRGDAARTLGNVWGSDASPPAPQAAAPPPPPPPPPPVAAPGASQQSAPGAGDLEPAPTNPTAARALLVICYNRPAYLERTLSAVLTRLPRYNRPHVYVSQDGSHAGVSGVIASFSQRFAAEAPDVPFVHWNHPDGAATVPADQAQYAGYYRLSQHFGWALRRLFDDAGHPFVIVLEDDLEVAVDFFDYFTATEALLASDASLLAVSAWNDLGQGHLVADPRAVLRSDFFPGLGWMLDRRRWREELGAKWPAGFWDDWLREPPQRRGRAFLRPEVSRSYTFGESGVSQAQFFGRYLATVRLNDVPVDWAAEDLRYLDKAAYDERLLRAVAAAERVDARAIFGRACAEPPAGGEPAAVVAAYDEGSYGRIADEFGFISDLKAGVPRTAYLGVISVRHSGCRKFLAPAEMLDVAAGKRGAAAAA